VSVCLSVSADLQVLRPAGLRASLSGLRIPEPLVPSAAGTELPS
jgi:hypothetical protein